MFAVYFFNRQVAGIKGIGSRQGMKSLVSRNVFIDSKGLSG